MVGEHRPSLRRRRLAALALALPLATGCAIFRAMEDIDEHYQAARADAEAARFAAAEEHLAAVARGFEDPAVRDHSDEDPYPALRAQAMAQVAALREAVAAGDAAAAERLFAATDRTCAACHDAF